MALEIEVDVSGSIIAVQSLTNEIEELKRQIGTATDPNEVKRLSTELNKAEKSLEEFNAELKKVGRDNAFSKLGDQSKKLATEVNKVDIGKTAGELNKFSALASNLDLGPLAGGLGLVTAGMEAFNTSLLASPIGMWAAGIGAAVAIVGVLITQLEVFEPLMEDLKSIFDGVTDAIGITNTKLEKTQQRLKIENISTDAALQQKAQQLEEAVETAEFELNLAKTRGDTEAEIAKKQKAYDDARLKRISELTSAYEIANKKLSEPIDKDRFNVGSPFRLPDTADIDKTQKVIDGLIDQRKKAQKEIDDLAKSPGVKQGFPGDIAELEESKEKLRKITTELANANSKKQAQMMLNGKSLEELAAFSKEQLETLGKQAGVEDKIANYFPVLEGLRNTNILKQEGIELNREIQLRGAAALKQDKEAGEQRQQEAQNALKTAEMLALEDKLNKAKQTGNLKAQVEAEKEIIKAETKWKKKENDDYIEELKEKRKNLADETQEISKDSTKKEIAGFKDANKAEIEGLDKTIQELEKLNARYDAEQTTRLAETDAKITKAQEEELAKWKKFQDDKVKTQEEKLKSQLEIDKAYVEDLATREVITTAQKTEALTALEANYNAAILALNNKRIEEVLKGNDKILGEEQLSQKAREIMATRTAEAEENIFIFNRSKRLKIAQGALADLKKVYEGEVAALNAAIKKIEPLPDSKDQVEKLKKQLEDLKAAYEALAGSIESTGESGWGFTGEFADQFAEMSQIVGQFNDAFLGFTEARQERELFAFEERRDRELEAFDIGLQAQVDAAGANEEEINRIKELGANSRAVIERKLVEEEDRIKKKAFDENKKFAIAQAIISGAVGVVQAFASLPDKPTTLEIIAKTAFAASIAATTAAQVAKIRATQYRGTSYSAPNISSGGGGGGLSGQTESAQPSFSFFGSPNSQNNLGATGGRQGAPGSNITVDVNISESEITNTQKRVARLTSAAEL